MSSRKPTPLALAALFAGAAAAQEQEVTSGEGRLRLLLGRTRPGWGANGIKTIVVITASIAVIAPLRGRVEAQEASHSIESAQNQQWAVEAARLALAEARCYEIHLGQFDGPRLDLVEQSALKWSNTYNFTVHGNVFFWTRCGRPEAIACFYKFFTSKTEFDGEFHSLAEGPLTAIKQGQVVWRPTMAGLQFRTLPAVAEPSMTPAGRLVQMRSIARDFSAEVTTFAKTTHSLRLLTRPLLRYGGEGGGPSDGAVFAYARATDPDVLLVLEARTSAGEDPRWEFALARMHAGALKARFRDKEVWSVDELAHPFVRMEGSYTAFQNLPEPQVTSPADPQPDR